MTAPETDFATALRSLDPANELEAATLDPGSPRANATLERIISADLAPSRMARERRAPSRRLMVSGALVATVAVAAVVLPQFYDGDQAFLSGGQAFASWTAVPSSLPDAEAAAAAEKCRNDRPGTVHEYDSELRAAKVAVAERRGDWRMVVLAGADGFSAVCVTGESSVLSGATGGSLGTPSDYVAPGPREIDAFGLGASMINGYFLSEAVGNAGSEVTAVVAHTRTHGDVEATVSGGRYALWFPGHEWNDDTSREGVDLEVTYSDGTSSTQRVAY